MTENNETEVTSEPRNTREAYIRLLGVNDDHIPEIGEFPENISIPSKYLPGFFEAIAQTNKDKLERMSFTIWDYKTKQPIRGKTFLGNETSVSSGIAFNALLNNKYFIDWHTHPPPHKDSYDTVGAFSQTDIESLIRLQNISFISGIGSIDGGMFSFQTERAGKIPIWASLKSSTALDEYLNIINSSEFVQKQFKLVAKMVRANENNDSENLNSSRREHTLF